MTKGPPQKKVVKVYLASLPHLIYKREAKKRGISLSNFFKLALYEFVYRPSTNIIQTSDIPILRMIPREDRSKKGSANIQIKSDFGKVVSEVREFDKESLKKVPKSELKHITNFYATIQN